MRTGGGSEHGDVGETKSECVYLSFSSPDSDREQTTEDNEKQIFGEEEGGEKRRQRLGQGGEKNQDKVKKKKMGRRGKSDSQKRGVVAFIATGNRPSYVH